MPADNVGHDFISFDSAISACEKAGQWSESMGLLSKMKSQKLERVASLPQKTGLPPSRGVECKPLTTSACTCCIVAQLFSGGKGDHLQFCHQFL